MNISKRDFTTFINQLHFDKLFARLGWNTERVKQEPLQSFTLDNQPYSYTTIAELQGFRVLHFEVEPIPNTSTYKRLRTHIPFHDFIAIFTHQKHHLWLSAIHSEKPIPIEYSSTEQLDFLYSKINGLYFTDETEPEIGDVIRQVKDFFALNSESITKEFYANFRKQHHLFANFISGIEDTIPELRDNRKKQWYASLMLNRLMFCYFIQKKGFLNSDPHYLREKLKWWMDLREQQEEQNQPDAGTFYRSFYHDFLIHLFHDGLNGTGRDEAFLQKFGNIPYLNGGMFAIHQIEKEYEGLIDIADQAFVQLFQFFDTYQWHLDTRITASGRDINPDVIGYIFEQYINDRAQMGAYYTKEDITEYISRSCIVPHLLDKVLTEGSHEKNRAIAHYVWNTLQQSNDRYLYPAAKHGFSGGWKAALPPDIAQGLDTSSPGLLERRAYWNQPTPDPWAQPTEIWRESIARLQRCESLLAKIKDGGITTTADLVTYNLNARLFAADLIEHSDDETFIRRFYTALRNVTILDPTCGSGAFLFAAMNILEPLYIACLTRMQAIHEQDHKRFRDELNEIGTKYRSNNEYFVYKSIILQNLYGVDIMQEATEIAKLRLFLRMVAVVDADPDALNMGLEPLPDIDFNIRCGNTLVGYATEDEVHAARQNPYAEQNFLQEDVDGLMRRTASAFDEFRSMQLRTNATTTYDASQIDKAKKWLDDNLHSLHNVLDGLMHLQMAPGTDFNAWRSTHQPFHWIAEFYHILHHKQGFDIIIGNPPYGAKVPDSVMEHYKAAYRCTRSDKEAGLKGSKDTFAICIERSLAFLKEGSSLGFIVPISIVSSDSMTSLHRLIRQTCRSMAVTNFAVCPKPLFDGAVVNTTVIQLSKGASKKLQLLTTRLHRRTDKYDLPFILSCLEYVPVNGYTIPGRLAKVGTALEASILNKMLQHAPLSRYKQDGEASLYYRVTGGRYYKTVTNYTTHSTKEKALAVQQEVRDAIGCILSSNIAFWYYQIISNNLDWKTSEIESTPIPDLAPELQKSLETLYKPYLEDIEKHVTTITSRVDCRYKGGDFQRYKISLSKPLIDPIDRLLALHYGLTEEELDFIINYDIKYRVGKE